MAKIHVVINQKGGVGKTLIAMNLGAVTADVVGRSPSNDSQIAVASSDPQGSAIWWANQVRDLPFEVLSIHSDMEAIRDLRNWPYRHVFVDTPGWLPLKEEELEAGMDPLGEGPVGDMLRAILDQADDAIVPILTEPQSYEPTWNTIEQVLRPRGLDFQVVMNNWPPQEGIAYVDGTRAFCEQHGWPVANTVIRRYRAHSNASVQGRVVTMYNANRVELQAREDFYRFALEHGLNGASGKVTEIQRQVEESAN